MNSVNSKLMPMNVPGWDVAVCNACYPLLSVMSVWRRCDVSFQFGFCVCNSPEETNERL